MHVNSWPLAIGHSSSQYDYDVLLQGTVNRRRAAIVDGPLLRGTSTPRRGYMTL